MKRWEGRAEHFLYSLHISQRLGYLFYSFNSSHFHIWDLCKLFMLFECDFLLISIIPNQKYILYCMYGRYPWLNLISWRNFQKTFIRLFSSWPPYLLVALMTYSATIVYCSLLHWSLLWFFFPSHKVMLAFCWTLTLHWWPSFKFSKAKWVLKCL